MTDLQIERHDIKGLGGLPIAVHVVGQGRDLVLIHGYFSNAWTNWIRYGHAAKLVEAGFRLIMPDLRGHGESGKPHDAAAYPADALTDDNLALVESFRAVKAAATEAGDNATEGIVDDWTDQAEERAWFLFEAARGA